MSCVVGLVHKKFVYIGCDGIASTEDGERRPIHAIKIFRKGPYLIGFAGSIRTGQIIQQNDFKPPKGIYGWPDAIREQITEKGAMVKSDESGEMQATNFLIAYKGKLYELLCDFQINEVNADGYTAIGAGSGIALGSLFTSKGLDFTPEQRVQLALYSATEFMGSCGPPYLIEVL